MQLHLSAACATVLRACTYKDSLNRAGLENFLLYFRYTNGITIAPARRRACWLAYIFCVYRYRERIAGSREPRWRGGQIRNTQGG